MGISVVDTNVLIAANSRDTHASSACVAACAQTLFGLQKSGRIALDDKWLVINEYRISVSQSGQPAVGDRFLKWLLQVRSDKRKVVIVSLSQIGISSHEYQQYPDHPDLISTDPSDRKFIAIANSTSPKSIILNATDNDWTTITKPLLDCGIAVKQICPQDLTPQKRRRRD